MFNVDCFLCSRGNFRDDYGGRGGKRRDSDRSPPPAHHAASSTSTSSGGGDQQALSDAKNVADICRTAPKLWEGALILKNSLFPCKLHGVEGDQRGVAEALVDADSGLRHLKITQRLRLDQGKLDEVRKRMSGSNQHAVYLCTTSSAPAATEGAQPDSQQRPLRNLVSYLKQKEAAGVISMASGAGGMAGVLYCFPPCDFSYSLLRREAPGLAAEEGKDDHLVVLVVCGNAAGVVSA